MPVIASATPAYKAIENELNHRVTYNDIDGFQEIIEHYTKDDVKRISYVNDANNLLDKSYPETLITKTCIKLCLINKNFLNILLNLFQHYNFLKR